MPNRHIPGYTIIRPIFLGGMTDLYVARATNGPRVVLRFLKEVYARQRAARKRFLQSAAILEKLDHPHLMTLITAGEHHGAPYMVLPYIEAPNLRTRLGQQDALLATHSLSILQQLAAALHYLHRTGYWHLDFKPENILVADDVHTTLIDFDSCVKRTSSPLRVDDYPGTPAYVAPEWLRVHKVDERADIFSFGVVAYELYTGHKPFDGETREAALAAQCHVTVKPAPATQYNPQIPPRVEALIAKCLAKDPDARYPSMSLVLKDLAT